MNDWNWVIIAAVTAAVAAFCCFSIALIMLRNRVKDMRSLSKDLGDLARKMEKVADDWVK
jgi:hypothetical protein